MNVYTARQLLPIREQLNWKRARLSYFDAYGRVTQRISRWAFGR